MAGRWHSLTAWARRSGLPMLAAVALQHSATAWANPEAEPARDADEAAPAERDSAPQVAVHRSASELPDSPLREADLAPAPARDSRFRSFLGEPRFDAIVSGSMQFVFRSASAEGVDITPKASWGIAGTILLTDWLGLRLNANLESHRVRADSRYFGLGNSALSVPDLEGIRVGVGLEPRYLVADRLWLWVSAGVAWARVSQNSLSATGAVPVTVAPRSGVLVELPARAGVTLMVIPNWLGVSVGGRYAYSTSQTGDLFSEADRGSQQVIREDTGTLMYVRGLPRLAPAWSLELALDLFL